MLFKFAYSKNFSTKSFESALFESPKNVISIDCHPAIIEVKQIGNRTIIVVIANVNLRDFKLFSVVTMV